MQESSKLKGLAKIWREVKRPFRQFVWHVMGYHALRNDLLHLIDHSISTAILHQKTFPRFKNIHQGQEIVLVATGPTAKDYKRIDSAIHIGVNRAFRLDNIDLHYLFMHDYSAVKSYIKESHRYKPENCTKFYGEAIPESNMIEANALPYCTRLQKDSNGKFRFCRWLDSEPIGLAGSVIFAAMQFALWTNPQTIYLVGCDCSDGHFDGQPNEHSASYLIPSWIQLKEFAQRYYPETEILSINPVALQGVFNEKLQRNCP